MKKPAAFGKYFLLERINVGGMAEVFRAKAFGVEGFERLVAVKRILPNVAEDKEFIRTFIEEAKLAVQLNHANIAQIFDLGVVDGSYYIALEHVHGRDLRGIFERCRQLGEAMPIAQACFLVMKVCEGLDYAHNKRDQSGKELALVHRDVSPQNILVSFEGEVKLIDFGIAKAAGAAAITQPRQSGILKGKLGYMSPEQARGLPIDRKSDVFSCGVVLYELLTGERLFAGDSEYATLDKVRNVEILPPSTYNRKIPDELERIVLKALARDFDDRYPNAIDLHDELQAFVYTAGEFYSRKDLAGWMKKAFSREIEDETAKLESYRQLRPPPPEPVAAAAAPPRAASPTRPPVHKPAQPVPAAARVRPSLRARSQPVPVVQIPPLEAAAAADPAAPVHVVELGGGMVAAQLDPSAIGWEDDEVETQIYADQDKSQNQRVAPRGSLPLDPPVHSSPEISLVTTDIEISDTVSQEVMALEAGPPAATAAAGPAASGPRPTPMPPDLPAGSNGRREPILPPRHDRRDGRRDGRRDSSGSGPLHRARELSAPSRLISATHTVPELPHGAIPELPLDPMATFGVRITGARRATERRRILLLCGLAATAAAAFIAIAVVTMADGDTPSVLSVPVAAKPVPVPQVNPADPSTGFDLYVYPSGVMQWKLDGESRKDRLPSRIRGISPGEHTVEIEPPPGFLSELQKVTVAAGTAPKVEIKLEPIQGITGTFDSTPPGATVSLIIDGKRKLLGPAPATSPLDPRNAYQVLFEKPGYVSVNRPIQFTGSLDERVIVNLEKAGPERASALAIEPRAPRRAIRTPDGPAEPAASEAAGQGILVLGSKPPCEILVDGNPTGLRTPQKEIKLPAGRHRITLVNAEFAIRDTFTVDIKPDATEKLIKDYSDRLPAGADRLPD